MASLLPNDESECMPTAASLKTLGRRLTEELLSQGDLAVADELFAADCVDHRPGSDAVGPDSVKQFVTEMRNAFPDLYGYVEGQFVDGAVLVQRITVSGTQSGPWFGLPATGKRVSFDVIHIARVGPDGRIAESWSVGDELGLLRQLGQVDVPGP